MPTGRIWGQSDLSTRRKKRALGQIDLSPHSRYSPMRPYSCRIWGQSDLSPHSRYLAQTRRIFCPQCKGYDQRADLRGQELAGDAGGGTVFQGAAGSDSDGRFEEEGDVAGRDPAVRGAVRVGGTAGQRGRGVCRRGAEVHEAVGGGTDGEGRGGAEAAAAAVG